MRGDVCMHVTWVPGGGVCVWQQKGFNQGTCAAAYFQHNMHPTGYGGH
jgi:hypothetical protein